MLTLIMATNNIKHARHLATNRKSSIQPINGVVTDYEKYVDSDDYDDSNNCGNYAGGGEIC